MTKKLEECPICFELSLSTKKGNHLVKWKGKEITVPDIEIQKCQKCGEGIIDYENGKNIDNFISALKSEAS